MLVYPHNILQVDVICIVIRIRVMCFVGSLLCVVVVGFSQFLLLRFLESFSRSSAVVESCQVSHWSLSSGSLESVTERSILFLNSLTLTSFSSLY